MRTRWTSLFLMVIALAGYGFFVVSAAAPSGGYDQGQTLDPDCAPGDTDCIVKMPTIITSGAIVGDGTSGNPITIEFLSYDSNDGVINLGTGTSTGTNTNSIFIGLNAGNGADGIDGSAFIGTNSGANTSASYSNFMGINSGADAIRLTTN